MGGPLAGGLCVVAQMSAENKHSLHAKNRKSVAFIKSVHMKKLLLAVGFASLAMSGAALAQVSGSISLGDPGFYGRVDIGDAPAPRFINRSPVVGIRVGGAALPPPIYLHVRPGYERDWRHHCREYDACGQPVYFVRHDWYANTYVPHYREHHRDEHRDDHRYDHREHHDDHHDDHDHR